MYCGNCDATVTHCEQCHVEFADDDEIMCVDSSSHVCDVCLEDWLRDHHECKITNVRGGE